MNKQGIVFKMDNCEDNSNDSDSYIVYEEIDDEDADENFEISEDDLRDERYDVAEDVPKTKKVK